MGSEEERGVIFGEKLPCRNVGEVGDAGSINESREREGVRRIPASQGNEEGPDNGSDIEIEGIGEDVYGCRMVGGGGGGLDPNCCIEALLCRPDPYWLFRLEAPGETVKERDIFGSVPDPNPGPDLTPAAGGGGVTNTETDPFVAGVLQLSISIETVLALSSRAPRRKGFMTEEELELAWL